MEECRLYHMFHKNFDGFHNILLNYCLKLSVSWFLVPSWLKYLVINKYDFNTHIYKKN